MPIYEYKGQQYEMSETDPAAAKAKILSYLGESTPQEKSSSLLDKLPKGVPAWMQSKPGQAVDAQAAGGDPTNPMAYLSEAQKTEQGPAMQAVSQGVNRALQYGAGLTKGAVLNPVAAIAETIGGDTGVDFSAQMKKSYEQQRAASGAEGFDWAELFGSVLSPVNRLIPGGSGKSLLGTTLKSAGGGALGAVLTPVAEEGMTQEDVLREKAKQASIGAALGTTFAMALPAFKTGARELLDKGVELRPGQAFGGPAGTLMRQAESFVDTAKRFLGREATSEKVNRTFTLATVDEVLSGIGQKLPKVYPDGQEAVDAGAKLINKAYPEAFNGLGKVQANDDFLNAVRTLRDDARNILDEADYNKLDKELKRRLISKFTPTQGVAAGASGAEPGVLQTVYATDGQKLHDIKKYLKAKVQNLSQGTDSEMYDAFKNLSNGFDNFIYSVDKTGSIKAVDKAYSEMLRVAGAAKRAADVGGNFSPIQLVKESASQTSTIQGGAGRGPLQKYAKQMQNVLGSEEGIAGTPITPSMLKNIGVGAGLGYTGLFNAPVLASLGAAGVTADTLGWLATKNPALYERLRNAILNNQGMFGQAATTVREQPKE